MVQSLKRMCGDNLADATNDVVADWTTPQRAGTCYYRSVLMTLRYLLRLRGHCRGDVKLVTLGLRRQFMAQVATDLRDHPDVPLRESDRTLIAMGCKQTAHAALKARANNRVSDTQLTAIRRELDNVLLLREAHVRMGVCVCVCVCCVGALGRGWLG